MFLLGPFATSALTMTVVFFAYKQPLWYCSVLATASVLSRLILFFLLCQSDWDEQRFILKVMNKFLFMAMLCWICLVASFFLLTWVSRLCRTFGCSLETLACWPCSCLRSWGLEELPNFHLASRSYNLSSAGAASATHGVHWSYASDASTRQLTFPLLATSLPTQILIPEVAHEVWPVSPCAWSWYQNVADAGRSSPATYAQLNHMNTTFHCPRPFPQHTLLGPLIIPIIWGFTKMVGL